MILPAKIDMVEDSLSTTTRERDEVDIVEKQGIFNKDDALLAELGYRAELTRNFSVIEVFGVAFSIMSLLPSIASTLPLAMAGGPVGMTWGWLIPSIFIMCIGISMSEMGSAMPTSGGLYWWTFKFAPESIKKPLCFLAGYANTLGLIGGLCSIDYGFAVMLLSVVTIATDETFIPNKFQTYGVFVACLVTHALIGTLATRYISKLQTFCIISNLIVIVITCIALPIGRAKEGLLNSGEYVFTHAESTSNWPVGWAFFLSWMSPVWTIQSFDSCVHMAEEAANASIAVPFGILGSISLCGIIGFAVMAVLAATVDKDFSTVLNTAHGQPIAQIYINALGKKWGIGMMVMLFIIQWFMGMSIAVAGSRQIWAFSRDGALPFSQIIRVINYRLGVPLRAVWYMCIVSGVIGLLSLVDKSATSALFSLAVASNSLSWFLPIASRAFFNPEAFKPGPFYIGGALSRFISLVASFYLIFIIAVLSMWPLEGPNPSPKSMNYTVVVNGFVWIGCMLYYFIDARKWFEGPKNTFEGYNIDSSVADMDDLSPSTLYEDYHLKDM
jgi:amino acid transporter